MDEITRLARPDILALEAYSSARKEGEQRMDVFLDANENPFPPFPGDATAEGLNRYPEPQPRRLLDLFAAHLDVQREQLLITRGADEAIDLLVRGFCRAGRDGVVTCPPTFGMYEVAARIQAAGVHPVPRLATDRFDPDVATMATLVREEDTGVKLVFVCTPNNPTGALARRADLLGLCRDLWGHALVVVDEAYVEFSGQPSLATEVVHHPNLVVLRTLSKEYSLAGERCGVTVAHPVVIDIMGRMLAPYPLPVSSVRAIERAMSPEGVARARDNVATLVRERARLEEGLQASPAVARVFPSDANFLLVEAREPERLLELTAAAGVKVRDRGTVPRLGGCIRISVGTPEHNDLALEVVARAG